MTPQLAKEVRLLLPAWTVALVLVATSLPVVTVFLPYLAGESRFTGFMLAILALGTVIVSVSSFAREFSRQTFQLFLSQPATRADLWKNKIRMLAVASISVWLVFWILISIVDGFSARTGLLSLAAVGAVASTGLWTSLLVRHAVGAFSLSLLFVILVSILVDGPIGRFAERAQSPALFSIWAVYAAAAFLFARWLFTRAQDLDPWNVTLELVLPRSRRDTPPTADRAVGGRHPIRALVGKEIRLHRLTLVCAGLLSLAILVPTRLLAHDSQNPAFDTAEAAFLLLCLLLPIFVCATPIAEERKFGVHQANRCLPISSSTQFLIKLGVTAVVFVLLALALPLTMYAILGFFGGLQFLGDDSLELLKQLAMYALVAGGTAWYFSSLSRTTLGALITAIPFLMGGYVLMGNLEAISHGVRLFRWIAIPACLLTALLLSYRNFREHSLNARVWRRNALVLASVVAIVLFISPWVYYRTWEWVMPEPAIGSPHPALADGAIIKGGTYWFPWIVQLRDGRVWIAHSSATTPLHGGRRYPATFPDGGEFLEREDWVRLATSQHEAAGLRADGTLWRFTIDPERTRLAPQAFAEDAHWKDVAAGQDHFLAVKDDGTLWGWGLNRRSQLGIEPTEERIESPMRIGQDSDWYRVHAAQEYSIGVKEDGTLWNWGRLYREVRSPEPIGASLPGFPIHFANVFNTHTWLTVLDDGTLWSIDLRADLPRPPTLPHRIGADDDWKFAASAWHGSYVALTEDGNLRGANILRHQRARKYTLDPFERLSAQPLWAGVAPSHHGIYALAKDGTWWMWSRPEDHYETFLAPSRRPQRLDMSP